MKKQAPEEVQARAYGTEIIEVGFQVTESSLKRDGGPLVIRCRIKFTLMEAAMAKAGVMNAKLPPCAGGTRPYRSFEDWRPQPWPFRVSSDGW